MRNNQRLSVSLLIALMGGILMDFASIPGRADALSSETTVIVDPSIQFQTWQGWGTSLAWWAKVVGGYPEPARHDYLVKAFDPVNGLGLNIVRYNIGGGENPEHLPPNKQLLAFRTNVPGYEPSPGVWDWDADANQRYVLSQAIQIGADQVEAFSNSPPWWMTVSGTVTGGHAGADNLQSDKDAVFAEYLAQVVAHFRDTWNVKFRTLEPLNEPTNGWSIGGGHTKQEGCVVPPTHQNLVVKATLAALAKYGITSTSVTASDETSISSAIHTFGYYDATALAGMSKINVHSYHGGDRMRLSALTLSAGKDLWLSEYGDGDASGLEMSQRILEDINGLHPSAWVYWQVVDSAGGWGFLKNAQDSYTNTEYTINKKYYVMGQYSKFIRSGCRFIAIGDANAVAAYDAKTKTLTIVTTNNSDADRPMTYDLSRWTQLGSFVTAYRTSSTEELSKLSDIKIADKHLVTVLPAKSVTTYVIKDAVYKGSMGFDPQVFYQIVNIKSGHLLGVGPENDEKPGPLALTAEKSNDFGQQWRLVGQSNGIYKIVNRAFGLLLDIPSDASKDGSVVELAPNQPPSAPQANRLWSFESRGHDQYQIANMLTELNLGDAGGKAILQKNAEQWRIIAVRVGN